MRVGGVIGAGRTGWVPLHQKQIPEEKEVQVAVRERSVQYSTTMDAASVLLHHSRRIRRLHQRILWRDDHRLVCVSLSQLPAVSMILGISWLLALPAGGPVLPPTAVEALQY